MQISPTYILELMSKIVDFLNKTYDLKMQKIYFERWQKVIEENEFFVKLNFDISKNARDEIDVLETLRNIKDDNLILQIAVDLGIEIPGFIYSIAEIKGINKYGYQNAQRIFEEATLKVYVKPDESIGIANSALESIITHIMEENIIKCSFNSHDSLYQKTQNILKAIEFMPNKEANSSIRNIGSSLLNISKEIEDLRSDKTKLHGAGRAQYLIDDPLYAFFVVNCVATVGLFLIGYYQRKINATHEAEETDDVPF